MKRHEKDRNANWSRKRVITESDAWIRGERRSIASSWITSFSPALHLSDHFLSLTHTIGTSIHTTLSLLSLLLFLRQRRPTSLLSLSSLKLLSWLKLTFTIWSHAHPLTTTLHCYVRCYFRCMRRYYYSLNSYFWSTFTSTTSFTFLRQTVRLTSISNTISLSVHSLTTILLPEVVPDAICDPFPRFPFTLRCSARSPLISDSSSSEMRSDWDQSQRLPSFCCPWHEQQQQQHESTPFLQLVLMLTALHNLLLLFEQDLLSIDHVIHSSVSKSLSAITIKSVRPKMAKHSVMSLVF